MGEKIFDLQAAIFQNLKLIFHDEIGIFLTNRPKNKEKYIIFESIKEEWCGGFNYSKFTCIINIFTGISQNFLISTILGKIKFGLKQEIIESLLQDEVLYFEISETYINTTTEGYFSAKLNITCSF